MSVIIQPGPAPAGDKDLYFAEGNRAPNAQWYRVMRHSAPTLYGSAKHTVRRACQFPCPHDEPAIDFLPDYATADKLAKEANIHGRVRSGKPALVILAR